MAKAKSGLGRGLGSLLGEANAEVGSGTPTTMAPIDALVPNPNQPRKNFDKGALEELADSIRQNGILQPILVRKVGSDYEIVAGERRYQAARLAELKEVPVVIREISDDQVFQLALIENLQRSDLDPIEEAQGYRQLIDQNGLTQEQLAKAVSKSRSTITNSLRLLDLPESVQALMSTRELTAGHARAILAVPSMEGRIKLAKKVVEERLSVRQTENLASLFSGNADARTPRVPTPKSYKRAAKLLRSSLNTGVRVRSVRGKNKIEIEFSDEEELERLVRLIEGRSLEEEIDG